MLEHLGLGVMLSLDDEFSGKSEVALSSFQRLQRGAEGMSKGVSDSMRRMERDFSARMMSLQNLMLAGFSFDQVGRKVDNFGRAIISTFKDIGGAISSTGSQFDDIKAQFKTIYGHAKVLEKLDWATKFSIKTPFQIKDTARAMAGLQSVGLDVTKQFKDANGQMKSFLTFVGDLSTRNMSETGGIKGMMLALSNLASGQTRSLQMRFDIPKSEMEKLKGLEGDALMQKYVDLTNKLAPNAMGNMIGTWEQILAEMEDKWSVFLWKLGDTGAMDAMKKTLNKLSVTLGEVTSSIDFKSLGNIFTSLWKPVDLFATGLAKGAKWLSKMTAEHPMIAKLLISMTALGGITAVLFGSMMKFTGSIIVGIASIGSLALNIKMLNTLYGVTIPLNIDKAVGAFRGLMGLMGVMGIVGTGLYFGWKNNMFGIASSTTKTYDTIKSKWGMAQAVLEHGTATLRHMGENVDNLTMKFAKIKAVGMVLNEVLFGKFDKKGKFAFSEEATKAIQHTGLLNFARFMVVAKQRVETFWDGVTKGLGIVTAYVKGFMDIALIPVKGILKLVGVEFEPFINFLSGKMDGGKSDKYWNNQIERFRTVGKVVGGIVGTLATLKLYSAIGSVLSKPFKTMSRSVDKASNKVSKLKGVMKGLSLGGMLDGMSGGMFSRTKKFIGGYHHNPNTYKNGRVNMNTMHPAYTGNVLNSYPNGVYATRGNLRAKLFGQKYVDKNGKVVGKFGGIFRQNRDDRQLTMGYQNATYKGDNNPISLRDYSTGVPRLTELGNIKRDANGNAMMHYDKDKYLHDKSFDMRKGQAVMRMKDLLGYRGTDGTNSLASMDAVSKAKRAYLSDYRTLDKYGATKSSMRGIHKMLKGASPEELSKILSSSDSAKGYMDNYISKHGQMSEGAWKKAQTKFLADNRALSKHGAIADSRKLFGKSGLALQQHMSQGSSVARGILNADTRGQGNQGVFKASRSKLMRNLFGDKYYTMEQSPDGVIRRRTVARSGGLLRDHSNDLQYRAPKATMGDKLRGYMGGKISGAKGRLQSGLGVIRGKIGDRLAPIGNRFSSIRAKGSSQFSRLGNALSNSYAGSIMRRSKVGRYMGAVAGNVGTAIRNRPSVGFKTRAGNLLLGKQRYDTAGNAMGRRGGMLGLAKGTAKMGGGILKGAGRMAGGFLRNLPMMAMMGSMAVGGWKALSTATDKDGNQVTGAKGAMMNLSKMEKKLKSMDVKAVWTNFKTSAKGVFKSVGSLGKTVFKLIKTNGKAIFTDLWNNVKILASGAWQYVKENGTTLLKGLFSWIVSDGVPMALRGIWGITKWLATDFIPAMWSGFTTLLGWFATDGLKLAVSGLLKIVSWLGTDFVPTAIDWLKAIPEGIASGVSKIFSQVWDSISSVIPNWIKRLFGGGASANVTVTEKRNSRTNDKKDPKRHNSYMDYHHGGLWLSGEEHPAIIRKDETVLPPDISRKLNASLNKGSQTSQEGQNIKIEKVEIIVKADKLSRADARNQAKMVLEEFKKLGKEKGIRNYSNAPSVPLGI